jgi:hypothetical protein
MNREDFQILNHKDINTLNKIKDKKAQLEKFFLIVTRYPIDVNTTHDYIIDRVKFINGLQSKKKPSPNEKISVAVLNNIRNVICAYINKYYKSECSITNEFYDGVGVDIGALNMNEHIRSQYLFGKTHDISFIENSNVILDGILSKLQKCIELRELWPLICFKIEENYVKWITHDYQIKTLKKVEKYIKNIITLNSDRIRVLYNIEVEDKNI